LQTDFRNRKPYWRCSSTRIPSMPGPQSTSKNGSKRPGGGRINGNSTLLHSAAGIHYTDKQLTHIINGGKCRPNIETRKCLFFNEVISRCHFTQNLQLGSTTILSPLKPDEAASQAQNLNTAPAKPFSHYFSYLVLHSPSTHNRRIASHSFKMIKHHPPPSHQKP
jgi:hypothetical protein